MSDAVNHPSHYTQAGVMLEPIDVLRWAPFDLGNCLKYVIRAGHKGNELEDWKKARLYLAWAIQSFETFPDNIRWFLSTHGLYMRKFKRLSRLDIDEPMMFFTDLDILVKQNIELLEKKR